MVSLVRFLAWGIGQMGMWVRFGRRAVGTAALLAGLAFAGMAQAVPIYAYTFEVSGFVGSGAAAGVLKGSFSGALDSGGHITKNTLTSYHFEISGFDGVLGSFDWSSDNLPYLFSYIPGDTGSFALVEYNPIAAPLTACIGGPVAILCGGGPARGAIANSPFGHGLPGLAFLAAATDSMPVLNGFVVDIGDPVFLNPTPVPPALLLFGSALAGIAGLGIFRHRRLQQA
jgi:hypothetical protein